MSSDLQQNDQAINRRIIRRVVLYIPKYGLPAILDSSKNYRNWCFPKEYLMTVKKRHSNL